MVSGALRAGVRPFCEEACVAYRQLCAVTFAAVGLFIAACGGESTTATKGGAATDSGKQPPINGDQPTNSASDTPPANGDAPPTSTQRPPASSDTPAGTGGVGVVCQRFCKAVSDLGERCGSDAMSSVGMDDVCDDLKCEGIPPTPCDTELVGVFDCALDLLEQVCSAAQPSSPGSGGGAGAGKPSSTDICTKELAAVQECAKANGLDTGSDDDEGDNGDGPPKMMPAVSCSPAGGCGNCGTACATCLCKAAGDATKAQACTENECLAP